MAKAISAAKYLRLETELVAQFLSEGLTQGDAQGAAEAEIYRVYGVTALDVSSREPFGWVNACAKREALLRKALEPRGL